MQLRQLKELLQGYPEDRLRLLIGEMYKLVPKKIIEEKGIDDLIKNPEGYTAARKKVHTGPLPDFDEVVSETKLFIENARQLHYAVPNRVIHKSARPKWRFIVKRLYKNLIVLSSQQEYLPEVSELLEKLYCLICDACSEYTFNTHAPFQSIAIAQDEFYRQLVAVKKHASPPEDWITSAIRLIADNETDQNLIRIELAHVLLEFLETASLKELAVQRADFLRKEYQKVKPKANEYSAYEKNNDLVELVFTLYMDLGEIEDAVNYFKTHFRDKDKEVCLYFLLRYLSANQHIDLWLREYEAASQQGIQPRKYLVNTYAHIKKTGKFPS